MPRRSQAQRTRLIFVAAVTAALTLTACGSRVSPQDAGVLGGSGAVTNANGTGTGLDSTGGLPGSDVGDVGSSGDLGGAVAGDAGGDVGGGAPGTSTGDPAGGGPAQTGSGNPAASGGPAVKAASCDGFKNQTGITDTEIVIGNSSDISGPVPGLFEASQDAVKAYVAYFNATSDICGRKLRLITYDSRTDAGADQQTHTRACDEVFAMVGSTSAFDSGGAATTQACGLPDIRGGSLTNERNACNTCFGAQSTLTGEQPNSLPQFIVDNYGEASQKAAFLYINAGASAQNAPLQASAYTKNGMKFLVVKGLDISEFNYAPYVQELKDAGVEVVFWQGAWQQSVKLRQAMVQQDYEPTLYLRDPIDYTAGFVESGGSAVEGTVIYMNFTPFEEAAKSPQTALYLNWLQQTRPGATPEFFGVFSWSAGQLFAEKAAALGGNLSRATLVQAFSKTDNWTNEGMHSPQRVGPKHTNECIRFIQLKGGKWVPLGGTKLRCAGVTQG
jgi:ABC-type branched-subunit amino acid transport system substrate-binding protein